MPLERMPGGKLGINSTGNGGGGSFTIAPGAITVLAQPGMNPEQIAAAVMAQIKTDPGFMRFMANVGGVT
jgi:hypothetical protein